MYLATKEPHVVQMSMNAFHIHVKMEEHVQILSTHMIVTVYLGSMEILVATISMIVVQTPVRMVEPVWMESTLTLAPVQVHT